MKRDTSMMPTIVTAPAKPAPTATATPSPDETADTAAAGEGFDEALALAAGAVAGDDEADETAESPDAPGAAVALPLPILTAVLARPVIVTPPAVAQPPPEAIETALQSIEAEWQAALATPQASTSAEEAAVAAIAPGHAPAREDAPEALPAAAADLPGALRSTTGHDTAAIARHTAPLSSQVGTPGWSDELSARLVWLAKDGVQAASLRLSPAHLGPLEVHIAVRGDEAVVSFGASHADTRAALEQALPRLREMFASQGLQLTHADVSGRDPRGGETQASHHALRGLSRGDAPEGEAVTPARVRVGLLDLYA